jgi:hypothetical protein
MTRRWQDYWHWKDKPVQERASARTVLEAAGVKIAELRSRTIDQSEEGARRRQNSRATGVLVRMAARRPYHSHSTSDR